MRQTRVQMQMKFKSLDKCWTAESTRGIKSDKSIDLSSVVIYKSTNTQQKLWKRKSIKTICCGDILVNLTPKNDEEEWSKNNRIAFNCNEQLHLNSSKRCEFSKNQQTELKQMSVASSLPDCFWAFNFWKFSFRS